MYGDKPHFADFNLVSEGWGGYVYPWVKDTVVAFKDLFASFEETGRKGLGGEGNGKRRKSTPLVWELKKPTRKGDARLM